MLDRVDMDVIHMSAVVLLVTDQMFPETSLPDIRFALGIGLHFDPDLLAQCSHERAFEQANSPGEIDIARRQHHQHMQVIR